MTTTVQMLKDRPDGNGGTYTKGSTVSIPDDLAEYFRSTSAARLVSVDSEQTSATAHLNADGRRYNVQTRTLRPVMSEVSLSGGIGIIGPDGKQVAGTSSPYAFTTRALADYDNGQTRICASAQTATVNASMPVGFGVAFKGAISFTAGSGVIITDVRTTGATNPWCALVQTGTDAYDILGTKA